jgi:hypothetical protein
MARDYLKLYRRLSAREERVDGRHHSSP